MFHIKIWWDESQVLGEKVNFFNSLGIIEISGIYKLSIYIDIARLKIFTEQFLE